MTGRPNLRFPGFTEEWEVKKLGEIASFFPTNSFSRDKLNYEKGKSKNIHYGDIHTKFQTQFDILSEDVPFINFEVSIEKISQENYCKEGDIVFADASEDLNDVGKSIEIVNTNNEKLLAGLHTLLARPNRNLFSTGFLGYNLQSSASRYQIQREAQGTKVLGISVGRISNVEIKFPELKEQQKISSFLTLIDERINKSRKIIEELDILLKGSIQRLILSKKPNKKLKECVTSYSSTLKESDVKNELGCFPVYGAVGIIGYNTESQVNEDAILIVKDGSGVGSVQFAKADFSVIGTLNYLKASESISLRYIFYCLKYFHFGKYKVGSGIPHIYFKDYGEAFIFCPSLPEQQKIAQTLSAIDQKIELEKQHLDLLKQQKQYLLQNLFV